MPPPPVKRRIVEEFVRKYPNEPAQTIARWIRAALPDLFPNLAAARGTVRDVIGTSAPNRRHRADPDLKRELGKPHDPRPKIPRGWRGHKWRPHVVKARKTLALYDLHMPYHDERAVASAVDYGIKRGCDHLFLGGDVADCYPISQYTRDPRRRKSLSDELTVVREFLREVTPHFERCTYLAGNHEDRLPRLVSDKSPELWELAHVGWHALLDLEKWGIEWVADQRAVLIGKLYLLHGHEIRSVGGVNPARTLFRKVTDTAMCGHFHRKSEHSQPVLKLRNRTMATCWSVGSLMRLDGIDYDRYHNYVHGLAIIHTDPGGGFSVENRWIDEHGKVQ